MNNIDKVFVNALRRKDVPAAIKALQAGANPDTAKRNKIPILHAAAVQGRIDLVNALLTAGANVNEKDGDGFTALMWLAATGFTPEQLAVFDVLVKAGAHLNATNNQGSRPLDSALAFDNFRMVKRLVDAGAQVQEFQRAQIEEHPPVTPEEYQIVRDGKGTPEQIARVRAALRDMESPLWQSLGKSAPWARIAIERKYRTPSEEQRIVERLTPIAQQNFYRIIDYLRCKRETGVLTEQEVNGVLESTLVEHLDDPRPTPAHYAMCVSRMIKAVINIHPELSSEVKALPISPKR